MKANISTRTTITTQIMSSKVNPNNATAQVSDLRVKLFGFGEQLRLNKSKCIDVDVEKGLQELSYASIPDAFESTK